MVYPSAITLDPLSRRPTGPGPTPTALAEERAAPGATFDDVVCIDGAVIEPAVTWGIIRHVVGVSVVTEVREILK